MKYIKSFADTSAMNEFIENTTENGYYLLRDESKQGQDRINYVKINNLPYLCYTALENGTFSYTRQNYLWTNILYSIDNGDNWVDIEPGTIVSIALGLSIYIRRNASTMISVLSRLGNINLTGSFNVKGNIASILTSDYLNLTGDVRQWCDGEDFSKGLFPGHKIINLSLDCNNMYAPYLFQYIIWRSEYSTSTIKNVLLYNVNNAAEGLFTTAFYNAQSMETVKCLCENVNNGFLNWMRDVSATGTFYKKRGVEWPTGDSGIPSGWTVVEVDE